MAEQRYEGVKQGNRMETVAYLTQQVRKVHFIRKIYFYAYAKLPEAYPSVCKKFIKYHELMLF